MESVGECKVFCQEDGHMTNFLKWQTKKTQVGALLCSFINVFELCSRLLPL